MKADELNRRTWEQRDVVGEYAGRGAIWTVEKTIFEKYRADLLNRRILDVGCGAGRTTPALLEYSRHYLGLDYSEGMLAQFRRKFPGVPIAHGDMRRMTAIGDGTCDVAFCSFNTLDYVAHADRLTTLGEFHRVLAENGLLIFSSHNLNGPITRGGPHLAWNFHPLKLARNVALFAAETWRHAKNRRKEESGDGYAILNDCGHGYRLLSYYIDKRRQAAQLAAAGFRLLECYDRTGRAIGLQHDDRGSSFIYYVARKQSP